MDFVNIGGSRTVDGLSKMLRTAIGINGYTDSPLVEVPIALFIIEVAKIAPDKEDWFPCGKWATIQALQDKVSIQLSCLFNR